VILCDRGFAHRSDHFRRTGQGRQRLITDEELTLLQIQQDLVAIRPKRGIAPMRQRELIPIRTQDLTEIGKFCN
jgi:hypothetical protein